MAKHWIQAAIGNPGALTRKAKAAGETVSEYSRSTKGKSTTTKRQINLAKTLAKLRKKRRS